MRKQGNIEQHAIFGVVDNRENGINYNSEGSQQQSEVEKAFLCWKATYLQLRLSVLVCLNVCKKKIESMSIKGNSLCEL